MEEYKSTNCFTGWAHMFVAHLMTCNGLKSVQEAQTIALVSCLRALLYLKGDIDARELSDNECILAVHSDWITRFMTFKPSKEGLDFWIK